MKKDAKAAHFAHKISMLKLMEVPDYYESSDPGTMTDINLRERTHLIRVSDHAAEFFYYLHSEMSVFFQQKVDNSTPVVAYETICSKQSALNRFLAISSEIDREVATGKFITFLQ